MSTSAIGIRTQSLNLLTNPNLIVGVLGWIALNLAALYLAGGYLPFDRPALVGMPFAVQMAVPTLGMIQIFAMMGLVCWLTRKREPIDMAARAPDRRRAAIETGGLLTYAILGQVGGWILGPAMGYSPFSFHLAGTLVGCSRLVSPGETIVWCVYNFVVFAVITLLWFRRQYTPIQLNLKSMNIGADVWIILIIGVVESATEVATLPGIFKLAPHTLLLAAPLTFALYFFGTVLPTMILIYAILLPRYLKLTGSIMATVILGGLTYALMHLVEGWSSFANPRDTALSLIFVFLTYTSPGMFKSYFTLRTGNAWAHALGYHAFAPHLFIDTPLIAKVFAIR